MTWTRVDHDDPALVATFADDELLAGWLRLRLLADQTWPAAPSIPRLVTDRVLGELVDGGHVQLVDGDRYRMPSIDAERETRHRQASDAGKESARKRASQRPFNDRSTTVERQPNLPDAEVHQNPLRENPLRARARGSRPDVLALLDRGWDEVTPKQREVLDELADRHDRAGHEGEWAAAIIADLRVEDDPLAELMAVDRRYQAQRRREIDERERSWTAKKDAERRELEALRAAGVTS